MQRMIWFAVTKVHEATWPMADCPLLTKLLHSLPPEFEAASGCRFQWEDSDGAAELLVREVAFAEHVDGNAKVRGAMWLIDRDSFICRPRWNVYSWHSL